MKILIVANNIQWKSLDKKLEEVKSWYAPKVALSFDVVHTNFEDVPFVPYSSSDPNQNKLTDLLGVDPVWYDQNITPLAFVKDGYDMIMLLLPRSQWQEPNKARGWRGDSDQGVIQLHISCDENEKDYWAGLRYKTPSFFQICRHEIMHGLYMITGQWDATHFWWERGEFDWARDLLTLNEKQKIPFIQRKIAEAKRMLEALRKKQIDNREKLYEVARSFLSVDASPNDLAPDELACAESVNDIHFKTFGKYINPVNRLSTYWMYRALVEHPDFQKVTVPMPGDIIISPTGYGNTKAVSNGHVGIVSDSQMIMSNTSKTGKWEENFTIASWKNYYEIKGGYPVVFFRRK